MNNSGDISNAQAASQIVSEVPSLFSLKDRDESGSIAVDISICIRFSTCLPLNKACRIVGSSLGSGDLVPHGFALKLTFYSKVFATPVRFPDV